MDEPGYADDLAEMCRSVWYPLEEFESELGCAELYDFMEDAPEWDAVFLLRTEMTLDRGVVWRAERLDRQWAQMTWEQVVNDLRTDRPEPEEGDYVIQQVGDLWEVSPMGSFDREDGWDEMMRQIHNHMEENKFWPNVWLVSDNNNFTKIEGAT